MLVGHLNARDSRSCVIDFFLLSNSCTPDFSIHHGIRWKRVLVYLRWDR
jgi:hypothetical protein